jgi:hypothetical protein
MSIASQLSFSTATSLVGGAVGSIPYQSATSSTTYVAIGSSGQILTVSGGIPTWATASGLSAGSSTTATNIAGGTAGQVPYQTAPGVTSFFGAGTAGNVLVSNGTSAPTYNNTLTLTGTTAATSTQTGALQVYGGLGVGGDEYLQGSLIQVGGTYATLAATYNLINTTATTVNFAGAATALTMGASGSGTTTVRNNLTVAGNLTIQGTTTIVDSTVTNIADPIITLGGGASNAAPTVDDNKDRGIAFKWVNNSGSTSTGFFGFDDSTGYFTFVNTATITNEVVSGTKGALDANLAGGSAMALHYQSAADTTAFLAAGTAGYILQTNGTGSAPSWVAASGVSAGSATYADNIRTIAQTASASYYPTFVDSNNAANAYELVYTTSTFTINPATGYVGIGSQDGSSPLNVKALSTLSGTINSFQKVITTQAAGGLANNVYRTEWRRRRSAGTDWTTQNIHDGIWVDSSFTTPGTDTRTWWERDPNTTSQSWGDQATTWIFANTTGVHLGGGTNPQKTLQLAGTAPAIRLEESSAGAKRLELSVDSGGIATISANQSAQVMQFQTVGTTALYIDALQRVGIGTSSPSYKLTVTTSTNSATTTASAIALHLFNSATDGISSKANQVGIGFGQSTTRAAIVAGTYGNDYLDFYNNGDTTTPKVRMRASGAIAFSGTATYGTSGQILQSNGDAAPTWVSVVSNSTYLSSYDDRTKAPSDDNAGAMRFGFTSFANNNTSPYADYLHLRSYTDSTGGNDNLVMFRKDAIGIRVWQQAWGTSTSYSSYKDVAFTDSSISGSSAQVSTIAAATNASHYLTFVDSNNASATAETVYTTSSFQINPFTGNIQIGMTTQDYVPSSGGSHTLRLNALNTSSIGFHDSGSTIGNLKFSGSYGFEIGASDGLYGPHNTLLWGSVGIGTNSTTSKLNVSGSNSSSVPLVDLVASGTGTFQRGVRLLNSGMNNGDHIMMAVGTADSSYNMGQFYFYKAGAGSTSNRLSMGLHSVDDVFNILGTGYVGIGTTSPGRKLHVVNSSGQGTAAFESVVSGLVIQDNSSSWPQVELVGYKQSASSYNNIHIRGSTTGLTVMSSTGGVAVGTTSTVNKFEVVGSAGQLFSVSDSFTGTIFSANDVSGIPSIEVLDTGLVKLAQYNGQVAISTGTAVSGSALTVFGIISTAGTSGEIRASSEITAYYSSDRRLKENISIITDPIAIVQKLDGVYFDWTDEHIASRGGEDGYFVRKHDLGVIAQQVEAVLPELVATREDGYKAVKYEKIVPVLIEAIKSQQNDINVLKAEIQTIKDLINK